MGVPVKLDVLKGPAGYGVAVLAAGVVIYLLWDKITGAVKETAEAAGGLVSGNNAITQSATNWDGTPQTAYEGKGVIGTVGAAFNTASGGILSSWGESLGSWLYDKTHGE